MIGLTDRAGDLAKTYSGGMQRRLNIGIGLLHRPRLLILDEPTVGVDPQSRNAILESVEELSAEGMAVLYTTHYMEEAERLCDRIGIIDLGELKAEGTRGELVSLVGQHDRVRLDGDGDLEAGAAARARAPRGRGGERRGRRHPAPRRGRAHAAPGAAPGAWWRPASRSRASRWTSRTSRRSSSTSPARRCGTEPCRRRC